MPPPRRIDAVSYYDFLPAPSHGCGDIWRGLTSFGIFGPDPIVGLLITPSCDLSWGKSETATYLPVIPLRQYFSLDAALPLVMPRLMSLIISIDAALQPGWQTDGYFPPTEIEVEACRTRVTAYGSGRQLSQKKLQTKDAVSSGLNIVRAIAGPGMTIVEAADLQMFFGSGWEALKEKIIKNAASPALHFLPADGQDAAFGAIQEHSVALFRSPISIPVRVLTLAQEASASNWASAIDGSNLSPPLKQALHSTYPFKALSLKSDFLSDLLTRFSALYNRIGSPDFSSETVSRYSKEVDGN